MTGLFVRLFIKNNTNTEDPDVRTAYGAMAALVGIVCNLLLFAAKTSIGLFIHSISVVADAINNLSDAGSSVISFVGVQLAKKPADREHPFGHGRMEYVTALVIAFLVMHVGTTLFGQAIGKILHPERVLFAPWLVGILVLSILLKLWLFYFNRRLGRLINSGIMKATSADSLNDVLITSVTVLSIFVGEWTGLAVDGWMGLLVSLFVIFSGFQIAREALVPLLGTAADRDLFEKITSMVESYNGIVGSHDFVAHSYGPNQTMAMIDVEVPNDSDINEIHEIVDRIERDVLRDTGVFLVIHTDPVEMSDRRYLWCKRLATDVVGQLAPEAAIHDFRVEESGELSILSFDLVVPHSYSEEEEAALAGKIREKIRKADARCNCEIHIEHGFVAEE